MLDDSGRLAERQYLRAVGRRIRLLRLAGDLSQEQLAASSRISRNFLSSIERGAHGVDVVRLLRIARTLQVDIAQLVSESYWSGLPGTGLRDPVRTPTGADESDRAGHLRVPVAAGRPPTEGVVRPAEPPADSSEPAVCRGPRPAPIPTPYPPSSLELQ